MTISILKAVLVLVILAVMIILLIAINHFFAGGFDCGGDEIDDFRKEIENGDEVISDKNVFGRLVENPVKVKNDSSQRINQE